MLIIYASEHEHENEMWENEKMYYGFQAKILNSTTALTINIKKGAPNQTIRMISEKSCNIEDWSNGFFKILFKL